MRSRTRTRTRTRARTRGRIHAPRPPQHLPVRVPHRRARLHTQLVDQAAAQLAVDGEGLRLAPGAVQHQHQLAVEVLAERMLRDQRRQFRGERGEAGAEGQFGVVPPLEGEQPGLRETRYERVVGQTVRQTAQRRAAPQRERVRREAGRPRPVPLRVRGPGTGHQTLEDAYVQFVLADPQPVPRRHRVQPSRIVEEAAQPRHVVLQGGLRGGRRGVAPQRFLEGAERDGPAGLQEERGQQGAPLGAAHGVRLALGVVHGGRAEQTETQPEAQPAPLAHAVSRAVPP